MGEIVRVLKWRLDLDSAGMADGVEKAATSAERLAKAAVDVGERGTAGLKKTTTAAGETGRAFEGLGLEAQAVERYIKALERGAGTPLTLERNAKLAAAAFQVLKDKAREAGTEIPSALEGRVSTAIQGVTKYAAAMNAEIEKSGGLPTTKLDALIASMQKAEVSTAKVAERYRELTATAIEAMEAQQRAADDQAAAEQARTRRMQEANKETEAAAAASTKAAKDFQWFKQTLTQVAGAMALLGAGIKIIQQTDETVKGVIERWGAYRDRVAAAQTQQEKLLAAQVAIQKGLITEGKTVLETVSKWDSYIANILRAEATTNAFAEGAGLAIPKSLSQVTAEFARFNAVMAAAAGEGRLVQFAVENKNAADALAESYRLLGVRVPADLQKVIRASDEYTKAQERMEEARRRAENAGQIQLDRLTREWNARQAMLTQAREIIQAAADEAAAHGDTATATANADKELASLAAQYGISKEQLDKYLVEAAKFKEEMDKTAAANATVTSSELAKAVALAATRTAMAQQAADADAEFQKKMQRWALEDARGKGGLGGPVVAGLEAERQAAIGAAAANGEFGTSLDTVAAKVVSLGGELKVGLPVLISLTAATEADTAALYRNLEARKLLNDEQAKSLGVMKGMEDYLANLEGAYNRHQISLTTLISLLSSLKTQMEIMGGTASGPAKDGINDLIEVIQNLINTAGPRDAYDYGYEGIIERAFEEAGNKGK